MTIEPSIEQRAIIEYLPTHLRVAAGAGTGKTTTIVERLARLVEDGTPPSRALGITFTVKASDELRTRLRDRLGQHGSEEEVEVATYHSFCVSILEEFGALVGYEPTSVLLDEGSRTELAQMVLRSYDTELDLTAMAHRADELTRFNASLDQHLLTPDDVRALSPSHPTPDDALWLLRDAYLTAAAAYRAEKTRLGLVEFSDLITMAVTLVEDHPEVAAELADRYDIVLLDEYQDTDPAQRILLTRIFGPRASVTAVGDTDQTIYEWRGASLDNFERFPEHFPRSGTATETLPLSLNHRSDRIILTLANALRDRLPVLDGARPLTPHDGAEDGYLGVGWFRSERDEARWIAKDIIGRHDDGIPYREMAILVRKRAWIPLLIAAMGEHDIPVSVSDPGTLLHIPEVADVVAWLRVVADPDDEVPLLRILMGGQYRFGLADLDAFRRCAREASMSSIMGAVRHHTAIDGLPAAKSELLDRFVAKHEHLVRFAQANPVARTINEIVNTIGFWDEAAALPAGEATSARLNIARFISVATNWRPIEGRPTVSRFLRYLDALDASGREESLTPPNLASADAVELTTVHGAKGLEWTVVFVPGLQAGDFPSSVRRYDDPDTHAYLVPYEARLDADSLRAVAATKGKARKNLLKARELNAEYRLAYVATTRARRRLVMTGHAWQDSVANPKEPSPLLMHARQIDGAVVEAWVDDPGDKPPVERFDSRSDEPDPLFPHGPAFAMRQAIADPGFLPSTYPELAGAVGQRVEQLVLDIGALRIPRLEPAERLFSTSVTAAVTLAQCPLRFKWIHHDRLPRRPSTAAKRGTEFHRMVELHNLGIVPLDGPETDAYDAIRDDTSNEPDRGTPGVEPDPWAVFEASRFAASRPRFVEVPFEVSIGNGSLRGKVDAIYEPTPGTWEIVDYKSGSVVNDPARMIQLKAYAIAAADGAISGTTPCRIEVVFAYFGGPEVVEITEVADEAWIRGARTELADLIKLGIEGPWTPTPSDACRHCDFLVHCETGAEFLRAAE